MQSRIEVIKNTLTEIEDVEIIKPFEVKDITINGSISVFVTGLKEPLIFDVLIYPQYPFKTHEVETIQFFNQELLGYSHIMGDGSICIHTAHSPNLSQKLHYDIQSVKAWIKKYYIDKNIDTHYEHLIVPEGSFNNSMYAYFFNEVNYTFTKNQFGFIEYSQMSNGFYKANNITNSIIQRFKDKNNKLLIDVSWNIKLKSLPISIGIFVFIEDAPAKNRRFIFNSWNDLKAVLQQDFCSFLNNVEVKYQKQTKKHLPLLVGYRITDNEIHWQTIMLEIGNFPIYPEKHRQRWLTHIDEDRTIDWAITKNISPKYFFGRGKLGNSLTESKILIIGIGAIGSMIAKTFVRSGCTKIDLIDYDIKEPENICRSEYSFFTGINNKTNDLINELYSISPFFKTDLFYGYNHSYIFNNCIKAFYSNENQKKEIEKHLNRYDIIIDSTTDDDLLYVFSQLNLSANMLNFSISNHAKQLVCAVEMNRYDFVMNQFKNVLKFDIDDLHYPTGCWNPTFKASYNDINVLVQYAVKHINLRYDEKQKPLKNFVLETEIENYFNIKLKEF
jgi:hypothetical protein